MIVYQTAALNAPVKVHAATSAGEDKEISEKVSQRQSSLPGYLKEGDGSHSRSNLVDTVVTEALVTYIGLYT